LASAKVMKSSPCTVTIMARMPSAQKPMAASTIERAGRTEWRATSSQNSGVIDGMEPAV
jgi:hypothetical protein